MAQDSERDRDEIARRAYRRYEERGRADGNDQADWYEAEREAREEARPADEMERQGQSAGGGEAARGRAVEGEPGR